MKLLESGAGGGFEAYTYPGWTLGVGWLIFIGCILPIPLVYIVNYIKEYRSLDQREVVCF